MLYFFYAILIETDKNKYHAMQIVSSCSTQVLYRGFFALICRLFFIISGIDC